MTDDGHQVMAKAHIAFASFPLATFAKKNIKLWIPTCNVYNKHVTLYQHYLISKGKSYLSFNTGEDFLEINQSETRIACGGHVC